MFGRYHQGGFSVPLATTNETGVDKREAGWKAVSGSLTFVLWRFSKFTLASRRIRTHEGDREFLKALKRGVGEKAFRVYS